MKKLVLAAVLIALLAGCAPKFEPVGTMLYFESFGEKGRLHIRHANGHEYVCIVVAKFEEWKKVFTSQELVEMANGLKQGMFTALKILNLTSSWNGSIQ